MLSINFDYIKNLIIFCVLSPVGRSQVEIPFLLFLLKIQNFPWPLTPRSTPFPSLGK